MELDGCQMRRSKFPYCRSHGCIMITVMHGKHLIDFVRPVAELIAGALVAWCFLVDAPKDRKANLSTTGRVEFAPNRRATAAWLILVAFFVYLVPAQFIHMGDHLFSIVTAVAFASVAIALLNSFPEPSSIPKDCNRHTGHGRANEYGGRK